MLGSSNSVPTGSPEFINVGNSTSLRGRTIYMRVSGSVDSMLAAADTSQEGQPVCQIYGSFLHYLPNDSDGDGFADDLEIFFGTDEADPGDTPNILGDINGDGTINLQDALYMSRSVPNVPGSYLPERDIDMNALFESRDYESIYGILTGKLPMFPAPPPTVSREE